MVDGISDYFKPLLATIKEDMVNVNFTTPVPVTLENTSLTPLHVVVDDTIDVSVTMGVLFTTELIGALTAIATATAAVGTAVATLDAAIGLVATAQTATTAAVATVAAAQALTTGAIATGDTAIASAIQNVKLDFPTGNLPVDIKACTIGNLPVDITKQTVGPIDIKTSQLISTNATQIAGQDIKNYFDNNTGALMPTLNHIRASWEPNGGEGINVPMMGMGASGNEPGIGIAAAPVSINAGNVDPSGNFYNFFGDDGAQWRLQKSTLSSLNVFIDGTGYTPEEPQKKKKTGSKCLPFRTPPLP